MPTVTGRRAAGANYHYRRITMKRIYRSSKDKKLAGLCGGIGEMLEVDPTLIRLACVFLCLTTAIVPLVITYVVAWIIVPLNHSAKSEPD